MDAEADERHTEQEHRGRFGDLGRRRVEKCDPCEVDGEYADRRRVAGIEIQNPQIAGSSGIHRSKNPPQFAGVGIRREAVHAEERCTVERHRQSVKQPPGRGIDE